MTGMRSWTWLTALLALVVRMAKLAGFFSAVSTSVGSLAHKADAAWAEPCRDPRGTIFTKRCIYPGRPPCARRDRRQPVMQGPSVSHPPRPTLLPVVQGYR